MSKKENIALLLNVSLFLDERPAMTAFSQEEILEGIYTAFNLINGECANLPLKVLEYNAPAMVDPPTPVDQTNELYRTDFEIDQFRQAVITQTQYTLNMGNDFSQGSSSFSTGGLNASIQRPEKRDILAPGVLKFLQNARLYSLQVYSSYSNLQKPTNYGECDLRNVFVTYENGDKRYVHQYQDSAPIGSIAVIDNNHNVAFQNPNTVTFKGMDADKILDTDGNYKKIHDISNLAFYGPDGQDATTHNELMDYVQVQKIYSPNYSYKSGDIVATYDSSNNKLNYWKSNQHNNKGNDPVNANTSFFWWTPIIDNNLQAKTIWDPIDQVYKLINQFNAEYFGGMSKDQIYAAITASGTSWSSTIIYRQGFVTIFVDSNNALGWYESLQDNNIGHNPETETTWWKKLPTPIVDINDIILQITPYLDQEISKKVGAEINKYATQSVGEYEGTVFKFTDENAFNSFIAQNPKLNANMFEEVPFDYYTKSETDAANQQLNTRLQSIESNINTNTQNITTNKGNISTNSTQISNLDNKLNNVINGLQNGNIVNYAGTWSSSKTYNLGQCVTYQDKWYVSNLNSNTNHAPTGSSDTWWEILSEPSISLTDYYTKVESDNRFMLKTMLNTMFPVGSVVMTADNSVHALVTMFPGKFEELTDTDIAYFAVGRNSSSSNTTSFRIQQSNLPNINWSWYVDWANGITSNETNIQAYKNGNSAPMDISATYAATNVKNSVEASQRGARVSVFTKLYLNGNVGQVPVGFSISPKTLKVRAWKVISQLV